MTRQRRNRRSGVEDRWYKTVYDEQRTPQRVESSTHGKGKRWRARYVDDEGREHVKGFERKVDAQKWLDSATASIVAGTHVAPRDAQITVQQWCDLWIEGYKIHRESTVRQARTHIGQITSEFGNLHLSAVRPSAVKTWCARLKKDGHADSYVYALHSRLSQILGDAVHDGMLARNPCSRRTSPPMGKQKCYVATTEQVWALHDAMPKHLQAAVLLGAFAGLRIAEVSALRVDDVDFVRGVVHPKRQWPDEPLKTRGSDTPIPIPRELTLMLSASVKQWPHEHLVTNGFGAAAAPWLIERAMRDVRASGEVELPDEFTFHDLRHYLASLLISAGSDIKTVQARMRHASAKTTLEVYAHLWPDADESTRSAIGAVIAKRVDVGGTTADALRTEAEG